MAQSGIRPIWTEASRCGSRPRRSTTTSRCIIAPWTGFDTPFDAWAAGLDFFSPKQQAFALQAAQGWAEMANVRFELVGPGEEADIYFYARNFDAGGAFSSGIDAGHGSRIAINVANGWPDMQPGAAPSGW